GPPRCPPSGDRGPIERGARERRPARGPPCPLRSTPRSSALPPPRCAPRNNPALGSPMAPPSPPESLHWDDRSGPRHGRVRRRGPHRGAPAHPLEAPQRPPRRNEDSDHPPPHPIPEDREPHGLGDRGRPGHRRAAEAAQVALEDHPPASRAGALGDPRERGTLDHGELPRRPLRGRSRGDAPPRPGGPFDPRPAVLPFAEANGRTGPERRQYRGPIVHPSLSLLVASARGGFR